MAPYLDDADAARLGVCSWSLRPTGPVDLCAKVRACGLRVMQLHLDPLRSGAWSLADLRMACDAEGITLASGMMSMKGEDYSTLESIRATGGIVPDATWEENLNAAKANGALAAQLGLTLVTFHAGFLPHGAGPARTALLDRLATLAEVFGQHGVRLALETGQEDARTLRAVLTEINARVSPAAAVGINFDPANVILYGMGDPIEALAHLAPHLAQVHLKDANPSDSLGEWGSETVIGRGSVSWDLFFDTLRRADYQGNLLIEREAGSERVGDVIAARAFLACR